MQVLMKKKSVKLRKWILIFLSRFQASWVRWTTMARTCTSGPTRSSRSGILPTARSLTSTWPPRPGSSSMRAWRKSPSPTRSRGSRPRSSSRTDSTSTSIRTSSSIGWVKRKSRHLLCFLCNVTSSRGCYCFFFVGITFFPSKYAV